MEDKINEIYEENFYPNLDKLYKLLKDEGLKITKLQVKEFLDKQEEKQITTQQKIQKSTGHMVAFFPDQIWLIDIFVLKKFEKDNKKINYIFACVDVFTRFIWCVPMYFKDLHNTTEALKYILKEADPPQVIISDSDSAFTGKDFQDLLKSHDIIHDTVPIGDHNTLGIIDRFARTLKEKLTVLFLKNKSTNWTNYIEKIIYQYNHSPNSAIADIQPIDATNPENIPDILEINKDKDKDNNYKSDLVIGDKVRVDTKKLFEKGTEPKYSNKIYIVSHVKGKRITLNNGDVKKRSQLLKQHKDAKDIEENIISKTNKKNRAQRKLNKEDITASLGTYWAGGGGRHR
jgi:transposase InsO family protein